MQWLGIPYRYRGEFGAILLALTWASVFVLGHWPVLLFAWTGCFALIAMLADLAAAGNDAPPERFELTRLQRGVQIAAALSLMSTLLWPEFGDRQSPAWAGTFVMLIGYVTPVYLPPRRKA